MAYLAGGLPVGIIDHSQGESSQIGIPSAQDDLSAVGYAFETLTELQAFDRLETEWRMLEDLPENRFCYFQSFDWCRSWSKAWQSSFAERAGDSFGPLILTIRKDGQLVSLWPLMRVRGRLGVKLVRFLGEPLSQYGNILVNRSACPPEQINAAFEYPCALGEVDCVILDRMPIASPLARTPGEREVMASEADFSSVLDLTEYGDYETYLASLSKTGRRRRRKSRRALAELGEVEFKLFRAGDEDYSAILRQALRFKLAWLNETGRRQSRIADPRTEATLLTLAGDLENRTGAIAAALFLDGQPIAIEIGMIEKNHYYSYIGAFDLRYANYSPGKIEMDMMIEWSFRNGIEGYDFLANPTDYKDAYTNSRIDLVAVMRSSSLKGRLFLDYWERQLRPAAKRGFLRLPATMRRAIVRVAGSTA